MQLPKHDTLRLKHSYDSCRRPSRLANWQTGKLADWQTGKLANWQTGKLTDWQSMLESKSGSLNAGRDKSNFGRSTAQTGRSSSTDSWMGCDLVLLTEEVTSLLQVGSLGQQVVLLQANDGARAADPDVANGFLGCEAVVLDHVAANQHSCAPQPCFTVNGQSTCSTPPPPGQCWDSVTLSGTIRDNLMLRMRLKTGTLGIPSLL